MTDLKPFQEATVQAVLAAFRSRRRARRFLVADEVGLGKTVVAQHVILQLSEELGRPLVVFYMCSNLAIARQNRRKLLEILPSNERPEADCPIDRLSLLPACERPTHKRLNLYSLTPDTSIPIHKRHRRDGRQEERALVHALVERVWPGLFDEWGKDVFQGSATVNWKHTVSQHREKASSGALREAFTASVRQEFNLAPYQQLLPELRARWERGELSGLELIAHLRNALAASAVEEVSPDLVIFDEFQRFRDLLEPQQDEAAQRVRIVLRVVGIYTRALKTSDEKSVYSPGEQAHQDRRRRIAGYLTRRLSLLNGVSRPPKYSLRRPPRVRDSEDFSQEVVSCQRRRPG